MCPQRITATSFWQHPFSLAGHQHKVEAVVCDKFTAKASPPHTMVPLDVFDASLEEHMSTWLRKHGRALNPKLSAEQGQQLQQCFRLMDADGSGAIGSDELSSAFKLLGIKAKKSTIDKMISDAGADESGEVGYDAFVTILEPILSCTDTELHSTKAAQAVVKSGPAVSFDTSINEYRRKKIIAALHERDMEVFNMFSVAPGTTGAAIQTSTVTASPVPSRFQRSHSASSEIVEAALQQHDTLLNSSKRTASRQQKHQSKSALPQFLSDGSSGKPALPRLQSATQNLDNTSMLGCQMKTSAAQRMSSHAHHCRASAVHSIQRPRESHLAALKAHGDLDSVLQSAACKQHWPAQQRLHRALTKSVAHAGQTALKHKSKPVRDMFGVAADDSGSGADLGLVLLRPASRLW